MDLSSGQSGDPIPSDQSELDSDDSAFAKTPIRPDDDNDEGSSVASDISSASSDASTHFNERGDKTYFHVWSDMLTCNEMTQLDQRADAESANYVEGDEVDNPNFHKPLSVDTSMPCPLIQFGPIPKRRAAAKAKKQIKVESELAGDFKATSDPNPADPSAAASGADADQSGHNNFHSPDGAKLKDEPAAADAASSESGQEHHHHDERCCDFSVVAAKNKARLKMEARMRRLERKRLVRY